MKRGRSIPKLLAVVNALVLVGAYIGYRGLAADSGSPEVSGSEPSAPVAQMTALEADRDSSFVKSPRQPRGVGADDARAVSRETTAGSYTVFRPTAAVPETPVATPDPIVMSGSKSGTLTFPEPKGLWGFGQAAPIASSNIPDRYAVHSSSGAMHTDSSGSVLTPFVVMSSPHWKLGIEHLPTSKMFPTSVLTDTPVSLPSGSGTGGYRAGPVDGGPPTLPIGAANSAIQQMPLRPSVGIPSILQTPTGAPRARKIIMGGSKSAAVFSNISPEELGTRPGK